jgi:hypothetical protein
VFAATNNILLKIDRHGDDILNIHTTSMLETSGPQDQSFFLNTNPTKREIENPCLSWGFTWIYYLLGLAKDS